MIPGNKNMITPNLELLKESLAESNEKWDQLYKNLKWMETGWYRADEKQKQIYSLAILSVNLLKMFGELIEAIEKAEKSIPPKQATSLEKIKSVVSGFFTSIFGSAINKANQIKILNKIIGN